MQSLIRLFMYSLLLRSLVRFRHCDVMSVEETSLDNFCQKSNALSNSPRKYLIKTRVYNKHNVLFLLVDFCNLHGSVGMNLTTECPVCQK